MNVVSEAIEMLQIKAFQKVFGNWRLDELALNLNVLHNPVELELDLPRTELKVI